MRTLAFTALIVAATTSTGGLAAADDRVQPPQLAAPARGTVTGDLARTAFEAASLARGSFQLPSPMTAPSERGALAVSPFPTYSPEGGLSEWGQGWSTSLAITRFRVVGDLDYATDDLSGPWGRMVRGTDGAYYPSGLAERVRVVHAATDVLVAYLPDGARQVYAARVAGAAGSHAWHLTEVTTAAGQRTRYDWMANASGRLFLAGVSWGGVGDDLGYRLELAYELLPTPFHDFRAGREVTLDRRVRQVIVRARNAATGTWDERWRYDLEHQRDEWGPAFYLSAVRQTYASGEAAPTRRYGYRWASDDLLVADFRHLPELDDLVAQLGADVVQPDRATLVDLDEDGRVDLEHHYDQTRAVRTDDGFAIVPLARPADAYPGCLPEPAVTNAPRNLARLSAEATAPHVLVVEPRGFGTQSDVIVCRGDGVALSLQTLPGDWQPGPNVRLVDVNRDHRPDLVRVYTGGYEIRPNVSTGEAMQFGEPVEGLLSSPTVVPAASWLHDMNGDGIVDLVARDDYALNVWFGLGGLAFQPDGLVVPLEDRTGAGIGNLEQYALTFMDANHDGLTDLLATRGNGFYLFANTGSELVETHVPALDSVASLDTPPVLADLAATGHTELVITRQDRVMSLGFDSAATGLMVSADDGAGNLLTFDYLHGPPAPGVGLRPAMVTRVTYARTGVEPVSHTFGFAAPSRHRAGKYLIGYGEVTRTSPLGWQTVRFTHDDDVANLLVESTTGDAAAPSLLRHERHEHDRVSFRGVAWARPRKSWSGWRSATGAGAGLYEVTDRLSWEAEVCPAEVRVTSAHGELSTTTRRALPLELAEHLHCLAGTAVREGRHPDPTLAFREETRVTRDARGRVLRVESVAPAGARVLQEVTYDADGRVVTITRPGRGTTRFAWSGRLVSSITDPVGDLVSVERDPVTDGILALDEQSGTRRHVERFQFDGRERLVRRWDDLGSSGATDPLEQLAYQEPTATRLGAVTSDVRVAGGARRRSVTLSSADGAELTSATAWAGGWSLDALKLARPAAGETVTLVRPGLPTGTDPALLDVATLAAGAREVVLGRGSELGLVTSTTTRHHADVAGTVTTTVALGAAALALVETTVDAAGHSVRRTLDATRRARSHTDAAGSTTSYTYDAAGRLRIVTLADGARHRVTLDAHGDAARVDRDGIASILFEADPATGLILGKRWLAAGGGAELRRVAYTHDAAGRVIAERHVAPGQPDRWFRIAYDGAKLTEVTGDSFRRTIAYRRDGLVAAETLELAGWRTVVTDVEYHDDGSTRRRAVTAFDEAGHEVDRVELAYEPDAWGRAARILLAGTPLATLAYDADGLPSGARFATGDVLSLHRDPYTRDIVGTSQDLAALASVASSRFTKDARGLVARESLSTGALSIDRVLDHDARGWLVRSEDVLALRSYGYDATGLPTWIEENGASRSVAAPAVDGLGRVVADGDLTLEYGADGQLARATRAGGGAWSYVHDEAGQRLLKLAGDGTPVAAYVGETYLDADGLVVPVVIAGQLVGTIEDGAFRMSPADWRGTVMGDTDGTPRFASPFGDRAVRPDVSRAVDFVQRGFDADLGMIRMGVRDYHPRSSRFTTPDPLYLESPERCVGAPHDCSLYIYAANDPDRFHDRSGMDENLHGAFTFGIGFGGHGFQASWDILTGTLYVGGSINPYKALMQTVMEPRETLRDIRNYVDSFRGQGFWKGVWRVMPEASIGFSAPFHVQNQQAFEVTDAQADGIFGGASQSYGGSYRGFGVGVSVNPGNESGTVDLTLGLKKSNWGGHYNVGYSWKFEVANKLGAADAVERLMSNVDSPSYTRNDWRDTTWWQKRHYQQKEYDAFYKPGSKLSDMQCNPDDAPGPGR